jgi:hypothetical protein
MICNAAKINQVILSLMSNAIDACNERGTVTVRTRVEVSGESVRMEVADDGVGIDSAIRDRIFDPSFTTKPVGQGDRPRPLDLLRGRAGARRHGRGRVHPRPRLVLPRPPAGPPRRPTPPATPGRSPTRRGWRRRPFLVPDAGVIVPAPGIEVAMFHPNGGVIVNG